MTSSTTNHGNTTLTVCVGNYGWHAEGRLVDKWINLPMEPNELEEWKQANGVADARHEETYISDAEEWPFGGHAYEYMTLEDTNRVALAMDYADPDDLGRLVKCIECWGESPESADETINLIFSASMLSYSELPRDQWGVPSKELYGYELAEETGLLDKLEELGADTYFGFKAYGEEALLDACCNGEGYTYDDMPDLDRYSHDEIDEMLGLKPQGKAA